MNNEFAKEHFYCQNEDFSRNVLPKNDIPFPLTIKINNEITLSKVISPPQKKKN